MVTGKTSTTLEDDFMTFKPGGILYFLASATFMIASVSQ